MPECARIDLATKIARVGSDDAICATAVPDPIPHFQFVHGWCCFSATCTWVLALSFIRVSEILEAQSIWLPTSPGISHLRDWAVCVWLAGNWVFIHGLIPETVGLFPNLQYELRLSIRNRYEYDLGVMVSGLVSGSHITLVLKAWRGPRENISVLSLIWITPCVLGGGRRKQQSRFSAAIDRRSKSFLEGGRFCLLVGMVIGLSWFSKVARLISKCRTPPSPAT